jgi:DNA-3-methyladenine glycosylase
MTQDRFSTADFQLPTPEVARRLIGAYLLRATPDGWVRSRILETEAYLAVDDPASHAHRGPTPRNAAMFGPPGTSYVYFTYGSCHCLNVVTQSTGIGEAVLIRAIEPLEGIDWMRANRPVSDGRQLANGPGKICQALALDRTQSGLTMIDGDLLRLVPGEPPPEIAVGRRVGIRLAAELPLRFAWAHHPGLSRPAVKC